MTTGRTAHTGPCVFALALLFAACGDGGSEAPAPPAKGPTKAGAPSGIGCGPRWWLHARYPNW